MAISSSHRSTRYRAGVTLVLVAAILHAQAQQPAQKVPLPVAVALPAVPAIRALDLKADLSFLASDALAGRYTPSPGLEVAAEFIASQFRAAGLEPGGNQDYFQVAKMIDRQMPKATGDLTLRDGSQTVTVSAQSLFVLMSEQAARLEQCPVVVVHSRSPEAIKGVDLSGKAVIAPGLAQVSGSPDQQPESRRKALAFDHAVAAAHAAVEILVGKRPRAGRPRLLPADQKQNEGVPVLVAENDDLKKWLEHASDSKEQASVSVNIPGPEDHQVALKNVVGILRGTDPKLKDTCVLLTAHYDHIGTIETGNSLSPHPAESDSKDQIFNGANDDGSGTVSVIEIAKALSRVQPRPKRSIVFVTFFGEERGDIGSGYYGRHPVFPIAKTVADINLEQVGRTDSTVGKQLSNASLTGFDYSDVTKYLQEAGRRVGVTIYLDKEGSDAYFERSDNAALAEQGVPAHTLCVAFDYADYHGLGDEWPKIDYDNMAKVDRAVGLAVLNIANSLRAPQWNASNPKTKAYREAQQAANQKK